MGLQTDIVSDCGLETTQESYKLIGSHVEFKKFLKGKLSKINLLVVKSIRYKITKVLRVKGVLSELLTTILLYSIKLTLVKRKEYQEFYLRHRMLTNVQSRSFGHC